VIDAVLDDASQYQNDLKYIRDQMQQAEGLNQILRWANRREESRRGELRASPWNRFLNKLAESAGYGRDSTHELQKVLRKLKVRCSRKRLRRLLRFADADGDGNVTLDEFLDALGFELQVNQLSDDGSTEVYVRHPGGGFRVETAGSVTQNKESSELVNQDDPMAA